MTIVDLPAAMDGLVDYYRSVSGEHPDWDDYRAAIEAAGLKVRAVRDNPQYRFLSSNAQGAAKKYGVKSISLLAFK